MEMRETSLTKHHINLKAKMGPFAGFNMPIQYSSVKEEVIVVREKVGVFDVSHMGEFFVTGPDTISFVDFLITNDFKNAELQKAIYSPLCRDDGTIIDDLIAYKLEEEKVMICVNASNIQKDWDWISSKTEGFNIKLENQSDDYSLLAIQGPGSEEIIKKLKILDESPFPYYSAQYRKYDEEEVIIARTGYTGEDGFEVFSSHNLIVKIWDQLMSLDVAPCGLAARDVLRLEVCYPLYGHELNDEVTPLDAGLKWTVKMDKSNFIGKSSLENYKPQFRLVKLSLEKGIPREGYSILNENNEPIGKVTSGTMSVTNGKGIALGLVEKSKFPKNQNFLINIRKNNFPATYHKKPFVSGGHK